MTKCVIEALTNTLLDGNWNRDHFSHYSFTIFLQIWWFLCSYILGDFPLPRPPVLGGRYTLRVVSSFLLLLSLYRSFSLILSIALFLCFFLSMIVFSRWNLRWEIRASVVELARSIIPLSISAVRGFGAWIGWESRGVAREGLSD